MISAPLSLPAHPHTRVHAQCAISHTHILTEACASTHAHIQAHTPATHTCVHTPPQPEHTHHLLSARIFVMEALKCLCLNPSPKGLKRPFRGRRLSLLTSKRLTRDQESETGWLALQALAMTLQNYGAEGTGQTGSERVCRSHGALRRPDPTLHP